MGETHPGLSSSAHQRTPAFPYDGIRPPSSRIIRGSGPGTRLFLAYDVFLAYGANATAAVKPDVNGGAWPATTGS
jgi:hypothetical protein